MGTNYVEQRYIRTKEGYNLRVAYHSEENLLVVDLVGERHHIGDHKIIHLTTDKRRLRLD